MSKVTNIDKPKKIGGYDKWEVEDGVRILKRAEEIKADSKFLKVVLQEMNNEAKENIATANVLSKTASKLKSVFGKGDK